MREGKHNERGRLQQGTDIGLGMIEKRVVVSRTKTGAGAWMCLDCGEDEIVRGDSIWALRRATQNAEAHVCGKPRLEVVRNDPT